jgi:hypothetical protein
MRKRWLIAGVAGALAYARFVGPWQKTWGSTEEERLMPLPGDADIAEPANQITRAIEIDAPPEQVWPWIVQLGADRGGFYSYSWLENLFGLQIHNADTIVPEWQQRAVGDLVAADAKRSGGWYVTHAEENSALVMVMANVEQGRPFGRMEPPFMEFSWAFVLVPTPAGTTRLLVRERVAFGHRLAAAIASPIGLVSFVMTQKMMRGIRQRTELVMASHRPQATITELHA